jgi:heme a synthase
MVDVPADRVEAGADAREDLRAVRRWLLALILLTFAMVLVGGATRLTESGLSITEWNLVTGSVPPLDAEAWAAEFERYRQSPQYALLNSGMALQDFKTIYWWEWAHRELGRFIGLVYVAGFFWFVGQRGVPMRVALVLAGVGVLLGAQGLVGWIMVASGLEPGMTAVAPVKLALHLTLACLFFASLTALHVRLGGATEPAGARRIWMARLLVLLAFIQIALGGLVAGNDAGLVYDTWPLMDGRLVPSGLTVLDPLWRNFVANVTTVQFDHRIGAYVLTALILAYAVASRRASSAARNRALLLAALVLVQLGIGIATLIGNVPIGLALMHQATALILLFALVWNASAFSRVD